MAAGERAVLDPQDLHQMLQDGDVDTVVCALPDLWGRLVGKRVAARTFRRILHEGGGLNASLYLFLVDMDMEPLPGFALSDWDRGFQDFLMVPDLSTLRLVPWLERTALVLCDAIIERTGEPVEVSPRQILKRQVRLAAEHGLTVKCGSELEIFFFTDSYREAWARQYRDLHPLSDYRADYHVLQTTKDEWLIRRIRLGMEAAGVPIEFSKGEWGLGQHEINMEYSDALEMADRHVIYKNGIKEIAALGRAVGHLHGQVVGAGGRLVLSHPLQPLGRGRVSTAELGYRRSAAPVRAIPALPRRTGRLGTRAVLPVRPVREFLSALHAGLLRPDIHHLGG